LLEKTSMYLNVAIKQTPPFGLSKTCRTYSLTSN